MKADLLLTDPPYGIAYDPSESTQQGIQRFEMVQGDDEHFDPSHLHQVLWNLLRNAVRHSTAAPGAVRLVVEVLANQVELNVIDNGPGVARAIQGQLFEPFFTTESKGTGLGLYLARELCAANRAALEYVDDMQGAHFRVNLYDHGCGVAVGVDDAIHTTTARHPICGGCWERWRRGGWTNVVPAVRRKGAAASGHWPSANGLAPLR